MSSYTTITLTTFGEIIPSLTQMGFSNPTKTKRELMDKLKTLRQYAGRIDIKIEFKKVWILHKNKKTGIVFGIIEEQTPRDEEEKELYDALERAKKEKEEIEFATKVLRTALNDAFA